LGARAVAGLVLLSSLVAQVRMLALPDELAEYRPFLRALVDGRERAVLIPGGSLLVAALAGEKIVVAGGESPRPRTGERVAASDRVVIAVPAATDLPGEAVAALGTRLVRDGAPGAGGSWRWCAYRAER
jgi:hypothetical protein